MHCRMTEETHEIAARKQAQMTQLANVFGNKEYKEGEAFDRELQERRRQEKREAREKL